MAYLKLVSVTVASAFLLGLLFVAVAMLVTQGEHVAFERANDWCERSAPRGVTGWRLDWNPDAETFTCIYARNGSAHRTDADDSKQRLVEPTRWTYSPSPWLAPEENGALVQPDLSAHRALLQAQGAKFLREGDSRSR